MIFKLLQSLKICTFVGNFLEGLRSRLWRGFALWREHQSLLVTMLKPSYFKRDIYQKKESFIFSSPFQRIQANNIVHNEKSSLVTSHTKKTSKTNKFFHSSLSPIQKLIISQIPLFQEGFCENFFKYSNSKEVCVHSKWCSRKKLHTQVK